MSAIADPLSIEQFRDRFHNGAKPNYEFWDGEARQKAMPTKLHAKLQKVLANILAELGFYSFTELTLRIDPNWEPVPDVAATANDFPDPFPTQPVDVVVEILSPPDAFTAVEQKCERYAAAGIAAILVFDPVERKVWMWNESLSSLIRVSEPTLKIGPATMALRAVWHRFETER